MKEDNEIIVQILTRYIAAWMWHLIGVIFLAVAIIAVMHNAFIYVIITFILIVLAEFMAWSKQNTISELRKIVHGTGEK